MDAKSSKTVIPKPAVLTVGGESAPSIIVFQFCGLMWATEYNARRAELDKGFNAQTVNSMNTLLMAYAALQALILETTFVLCHPVYEKKSFRRAGIIEQYEEFLKADDRPGEALPDLISDVSAHRIALTHSEPDNIRSRTVGSVISATDAARISQSIRSVAQWLWGTRRPGPVASEFEAANPFLQK